MSIEKKVKKPKKAKTKRLYFGPEVDISIIKYNSAEDDHIRSVIYQREIKPAFEKLVENIIHTFKFYYTDGQTLQQMQHEVVSFLVEKLPKFKAANGKAFSYYSIVAKNYCILKNRSNYKKLTSHDRMDMVDESNLESIIDDSDSAEQKINLFMNGYVEYWDANLDIIFLKKNDRNAAAALLELFRKRDKIELYNKKALYIYMREMSDASTQQITKIVKLMKEKYKVMYNDFLCTGQIIKNKKY